MFDIVVSQQPERLAVWALHASASAPAQWAGLAGAVAAGRKVHAVALPGYHGAAMARSAGLLSRAAPVIAAIEAEGQPVHLVGHSFGAAVALKIAQLRPDLVASLSLYEPMLPSMLAGELSAAERAALGAVNAVSARLTASVACDAPADGMAGFIDFWTGPGGWAALEPERRARMAAMAVNVMADFADCTMETMAAADLAGMTAPTLVVSGTESPAVTRCIARRLAEALPTVAHVTLVEAGHMAPVTDPDRVNPVFADHIRQVEGHGIAIAA